MRKILFVLTALLLVTPALAAVDIDCAADGLDVTVSYDATADGNLPRGFGLDITVDNGATIDAIVATDANFWVYPGSIDINSSGVIEGYGTPVGDPCDHVDTQAGLGTGGITIEMGSLYEKGVDPNSPLTAALITFTVSGDCNVTIAGNAARGNVVLESTVEATVAYTGCAVVSECFPSGHADYAEWVVVGKPDSWCNVRQCHGDADGVEHSEKGLLDFWVGVPDLQLLSLGWKQPDTDSNFSTFVAADFDHIAHSEKGIPYTFRCGVPDLQILSAYWKGPNGGKPAPPTDCLDVP